ncbi:MAG TPA: chromosome segregation protein SMC, partial [Chthonomonadaceae bacterium]|nr:chromosome segregation protein SMC [Chthonomonadaceae bacterium]
EALEAARRDEWSGRKTALAELEAAVREALRASEERQGERLRRAQRRASLDAALKAACDWSADVAARRERLATESVALETALSEAEARMDVAVHANAEKQRERDALAAQRANQERALKELAAALAQARSALEGSRRSLAEQSSRLTTLTELQQNHEGFYQGVRAVLGAVNRRQLAGRYRAVVELLGVPEPYRVAIEVALGGSLQDIVTLTEAEAKAGIEWLKQNRAGRATFLALPLLRPGQRTPVPAGSDAVNASDVVACDQEYDPVLQLLLGRTLIAPDMDLAIALSRRAGGWSKIVTREGELLTPGGALTGGSLQGRGAHLVGRKGEIDDLQAAVPALREATERRSGDAEALQQDIRAREAARADTDRRDSVIASEAASASTAAAAAERDIARLKRDRQDRSDAERSLAATAASVAADIARLQAEAEAGSAEQESADDAFAALHEQAAELAAQRDACRASAVALEVEISRLREKRDGLRRSLATAEASYQALQRQYLARSTERAASEATTAEAEEEQEGLQASLAATRAELADADRALRAVAERRQAMLASSLEQTAALREQVQRRGEVAKSLHDTELRLARLEMQISQAASRLQEEYGISREEALARPDDVAIDRGTAIEVGRLRRELRAMGHVNTGAVAEYDRLTERYDFLTAQRADLDRSRESLMKTIQEIDESTRGVFQATFDAVRVEFERIFTRLFEGGATKLLLTRPDDVLETGIEVIAQPPGKKPQSLSLLSGGERALTATALLFAFLAVRPSPFVLLDEVDAPLDGVNVEKFTNLVRDFSERSQFLLITHNPTTMEAAPNWYGITMRQPGVSSVLSYRVPAETTTSAQAQPSVGVA